MTLSRDPTLAEVLRLVLSHTLSSVHVALPGAVESYDAATQKADIKPQVKGVVKTTDGDELDELPVIPGVPVMTYGGGGFFISMPLAKGDTGMLIVCSQDVDAWKATGGIVNQHDTNSNHRLSNAVFVPGLKPFSAPLADADAADMTLGKDGGLQLKVTAGDEIHLGAATNFVALANLVLTELQTIANDVNALRTQMGVWVPVPTDGGAALKVAVATWLAAGLTPGSVAATKVKAE